MRKSLIKQALVLSLILVSIYAYSQETVLLKYSFVQGKTYVQNSQLTSNVTQSMGGREMKMQSDVNSTSEYAIEGVGVDANTTILVSLLSTSVHSAGMGRDTTMNFKDLKDKSRVVLSADGKSISTVKVDSSEVSKMLGAINAKLPTLPNKSVKVGEKWNEKVEEVKKTGGPFPMNVITEMEYTLIGKEVKDGNDYYKISYTGSIAVNGKGSQMGMEMFLEGTGKTEGFNYFDPKTSMVVYSESTTEMDMTIAVSGQQNMTIPMTQSMKTIVKFEEKK